MPTMTHPPRAPVVSLTPAAHYHARQFWQRQTLPRKAKQVYLNTLAICATSSYLARLGIASDREISPGWDPIQQTLADLATLTIPGWGSLECRPVLPDVETCTIPPEVWEERRAYLAVRLNRSLSEAQLLGWTATPRAELPLDRLQPLTSLLAQFPSAAGDAPVADAAS